MSNESLKGKRVRIAIANPKEWTVEAYTAMNGALGEVTDETSAIDRWDRPREREYEVSFDNVVDWAGRRSCVMGFHFSRADLVVLDGGA